MKENMGENIGEEILSRTESEVAAIKGAETDISNMDRDVLERAYREKEEENRRLEELAFNDQLTGLMNKRSLDVMLKILFTRTGGNIEEKRKTEIVRPMSVIFCDLDKFKSINDTYGHENANIILREVAATLSDSVREDDVVARYGGEEILIILNGATEVEAGRKAEKLREKIEDLSFNFSEQEVGVTISMGVAGGDNLSNPSELIKSADAAMYESKNSGRNRVTTASALSKDAVTM